jgi:16S rRNA (cytidine1402-2'-O)-methyltransferase
MTRQTWKAPEAHPAKARPSESNRSPGPEQSPQDDGAKELPPGLYVAATPIGHARDITLRVLDALRGADLIVAEDTRVTAKLLAIYGISKPVVAYNDHNAPHERPKLLRRLQQGARIVQVSDAGTPLVSDPGFKLVREALAANLPVEVLPGASASLAALTLSGLPSDRFLFVGFLPPKAGERQSALAELKAVRATLIFYESPQRLGETLSVMAEILGPREAAVARELTKLHQEVRRASLEELAAEYAGEPPKGEIAVVVGPPGEAPPDYSRIDAALEKTLPFMPLKAAADLIAEVLKAPRREVYARGLEIKNHAAP